MRSWPTSTFTATSIARVACRANAARDSSLVRHGNQPIVGSRLHDVSVGYAAGVNEDRRFDFRAPQHDRFVQAHQRDGIGAGGQYGPGRG
jgi:hypothetical protein